MLVFLVNKGSRPPVRGAQTNISNVLIGYFILQRQDGKKLPSVISCVFQGQHSVGQRHSVRHTFAQGRLQELFSS